MFKQRNGAKVTKRHDIATTPHRRAIDHETVRERHKITMRARFKRLKPAALSGRCWPGPASWEPANAPSGYIKDDILQFDQSFDSIASL